MLRHIIDVHQLYDVASIDVKITLSIKRNLNFLLLTKVMEIILKLLIVYALLSKIGIVPFELTRKYHLYEVKVDTSHCPELKSLNISTTYIST